MVRRRWLQARHEKAPGVIGDDLLRRLIAGVRDHHERMRNDPSCIVGDRAGECGGL
jgi:hypothetical protein